MNKFSFLILLLSILTGQLIKIPLDGLAGPTLLDLSVGILCLVALIQLKFRFKKPPSYILAAFCFFFIGFISLVLTPLNLTFQEYLQSSFYGLRISLYFLLAWIMYSGGLGNSQKYILPLLLISGVGLAAIGLLQFIFVPNLAFLTEFGWDPHYFRNVSTFLDPNFVGAFFVLTLLILITERVQITRLTNKLFYNSFFVILYVGLLTTFSRGSLLVLIVSLLTLSILNKSYKIFILMIALTLGFILSFSIYTKAVTTPRNIDRGESAQYRLNSWQQGKEMFEKSLFFGIGFNAYQYALKEYNLADGQTLQNRGGTTNDSSLLFVLSTTGLLGFFTFSIFLLLLLRSSFRNFKSGNSWGGLLLAGTLGLLAQSFFVNNLFYPHLLIWTVLVSTKLDQSL